MASKPHPSWSEPQKRLHRDFQEAMEIIIPYSGPEIPVLDNHTPQQMCDQLGLVKAVKSKVDAVDKTLKERFKARMEGTELRGERYIATLSTAPRVAIDQGKIKGLIARADEAGINIERLIDWACTQSREAADLPERIWAYNPSETNELMLNARTDVETLRVTEI